MAEAIEVRYYDGAGNRPHPAKLRADGTWLYVRCQEGEERRYLLAEAVYIAGVGQVLPALELPDDARIEFLTPNIPHGLKLRHQKLQHRVGRWEGSWKWAGIGLLVAVGVVFSVFRWGIPAAAAYAAHRLPEQVLADAGNQAEKLLMQMTGESRLSPARQKAVSDLYYRVLAPERPAKLVFRSGGKVGANALAIPNHTIMLTDELVKLAGNDSEILAVLAHEHGHLLHRHSLQQGLRGIGSGLFLLVLTGDTGDLITSLPLMLVSAQYSQAFELEADRHAAASLQRLNLSPKSLGVFLQRLEQANGQGSVVPVLSTHPLTEERVKQLERYSR